MSSKHQQIELHRENEVKLEAAERSLATYVSCTTELM